MTETISVNLNALNFDGGEVAVAEYGGLTARAFRYASGVAALRIRNTVGEIVCLPFQGQQIAEAVFHGRDLRNRTMFDEPMLSSAYLGNCGGFLVHCGATAMGNPAPEDNHPLHGELPNIPYQQAWLVAGTDARGAWMGLAGVARYTIAFTHNYEMRPLLKLHADDGRIEAEVEIRNLKHTPMELMYLAHVNFRPHDGGKILDTVPDGAKNIRIRTKLPDLFKPAASHTALLDKLKQDPARHRHLEPAGGIDPELVMGLSFSADEEGWAHAMHLLPDGSGDFISHKPLDLPRGVRWIARNANQDALGLFLPGTAEADGYTAEKTKGNVVEVAPRESYRFSLSFGAMTPDQAAAMKARIEAVRAKF